MKLYTNEDTMKAEVLKVIFVGMPIDAAQAVMEKKGFKCHYGHEWFHDNPVQSVYCLICSAIRPESSWVFPDEIMVLVLFEKGTVTEVRVRHIKPCL